MKKLLANSVLVLLFCSVSTAKCAFVLLDDSGSRDGINQAAVQAAGIDEDAKLKDYVCNLYSLPIDIRGIIDGYMAGFCLLPRPDQWKPAEKKGKQGIRVEVKEGNVFFAVPDAIDLGELGSFFADRAGFFLVTSSKYDEDEPRCEEPEYTFFQKRWVKGKKPEIIQCVTRKPPFYLLEKATAARMKVTKTAKGEKFTIFTSGENEKPYNVPVFHAGKGASLERKFGIAGFLHEPGHIEVLVAMAEKTKKEKELSKKRKIPALEMSN